MEEIGDQVPETPPAPVLYLVPYNRAARQATLDPQNDYFRSRLPNDRIALYVSFENPEKQEYTLGRAGCDIFLPDPRGADISKHQCSFVNTEHGAVLLEDTSSKKNTEPHSSTNGGQTIGFAKGDASRRVLVARGINNMIHMGRDRYYQFEIHWDSDGLYDFKNKDENYRTGPRKSRQKRYLEGDKVGGGSYGNVFWAMDVHTGCVMAVKRFHNMQGKHLEFATREITNMFRISRTSSIHHDHILEILDCAGGGKGDDWGEIFMPLKRGNLKTLVQDPVQAVDADEVAELVLRQMLRALACIAKHKIVHRDLKPENVLWEIDESTGGYHFRLGDFGLSNNPELAVTVAGTEPFMAPEVFNSGRQTEKVDIWSLFATIVWVKDVEGFRRRCAKMRAGEIHAWLARMAGTQPQFWDIRGMASIRARDRPSARQLLRVLGALEEGGDGGGEVDEVADALANALELDPTGDEEEDAGAGPSRGWGGAEGEAPGVPYYETYVPGWTSGDEEGEGSRTYRPPPMGESPRAEAWVKPYDEPYGPPDDGDPDSGTAVPDAWTARQLPTREMNDLVAVPVGQSRDRKGKGKKKKG